MTIPCSMQAGRPIFWGDDYRILHGEMFMPASQELRTKLIRVIGNLICRCIEEARNIPYVLRQDELLEVLVRDPARFQRLVEEERFDRTEHSAGTLTAKLDALSELGQFESLDAYNLSWSAPERDVSRAIEHINRLSSTFAVYMGNTVTVFEREFESFTGKLCQLLKQSGMTLKVVEFTREDMGALEAMASEYLTSGRLMRAFVFERLLSCHVITKKVVVLPREYSLAGRLIQSAIKDGDLFPRVVRYILRASYISQGAWEDLFSQLVKAVRTEQQIKYRSALIDLIEEDAVFSCNLLCGSFADFKGQTPQERRSAIEMALDIPERARRFA